MIREEREERKEERRRNVIAVFLVLSMLPILSPAQNLRIAGKTNKPNALVRLLTYNDLFTKEQTVIGETYSDFSGNFSFNTVIQHYTPAQIAVDLDRVDLVLRPGSFYDINVSIPAKNADLSFFEQEPPSLRINSAKDNDMSRQLIVSETIINDFVYDYIDEICRAKKSYLIDTLAGKIVRAMGDRKNDFVDTYVRYKLAALRMAASLGSTARIITEYFDSQPVLYLQSSYVDLFNEIFDGYFDSRKFNRRELMGVMYSDYDGFWNYIMKDDFLSRNTQLAELIVMKYLSQFYYGNPNQKQIAVDFMDRIKNGSEYPQNRAVASDMLTRVGRLSYDTDAPDFSLRDKDGDTVSLSDYRDGMVLLQFVDRVSDMTDYEFSKLNELQKQWNDTISVVTIATKESFDDFAELFENQKYNWKLLNLGDDILLLEKYNIRTCPDYVILKSEGRIGMAPAAAPDRYLDYHVRRIYGYK